MHACNNKCARSNQLFCLRIICNVNGTAKLVTEQSNNTHRLNGLFHLWTFFGGVGGVKFLGVYEVLYFFLRIGATIQKCWQIKVAQ